MRPSRSALNLSGAAIDDGEQHGAGPSSRPPAPSIALPNQEAEYVNHIALDIGGSLVKLVYFSPEETGEWPAGGPAAAGAAGARAGPAGGGVDGTPANDEAGAASASASASAAPGPADSSSAGGSLTAAAAGSSGEGGAGGGGGAGGEEEAKGAADGSRTGSAGGAVTATSRQARGGRLHFVKFETTRVEDAIAYIEAKGLHRVRSSNGHKEMRVICTGGGAYRHADLFKQRLGVVLDCEDEMSCLVSGCNFLLNAIPNEAFTYEDQATTFVPDVDSDLYPYLLVNIGSGVSIVKVDGHGKYERVSGSSLGGGTFWGLARLLTGRKDFDEVMQLSTQGDNANVDMLVGDIYGRDYGDIGLDASVIASSFGKAVGQDKPLSDYNHADLSVALIRMISYNIGQLAYLNAMRYNIKRIFFGGFFIRGIPYTMQAISFAVRFWSQGGMAALFLRHEGFLGAVGAFLKVHPMPYVPSPAEQGAPELPQPRKARARFVERFGGLDGDEAAEAQAAGAYLSELGLGQDGKGPSWVDRFMEAGAPAVLAARMEHEAAKQQQQQQQQQLQGAPPPPPSVIRTFSHCSSAGPDAVQSPVQRALSVGVLHYSPGMEPFPLLADPVGYEPNTLDITADEESFQYWVGVLEETVPMLVQKAIASEGDGEGVTRRALAFGKRLSSHFKRLLAEPGAYGQVGLSDLFELREECLKEFGFNDIYRLDKERENAAALSVLPDLLQELDSKPQDVRLLALVEGCLAANLFDWGSRSCVELYHNGTILDMYRAAKQDLGKRPWAVDRFDAFAAQLLGGGARPYRRALMFVDNSGADVVLGMLPLARELLRYGCDVVLVANSLPAINDVTAPELRLLLQEAAACCPLLEAAREAGARAEAAAGGAGLVPRRGEEEEEQLLQQQPAAHAGGDGGVGVAGVVGDAGGAGGARGIGGEGAVQQQQQVHGARLHVVANGQGSPCMDFRHVPEALAQACEGADLLIIEGMGRAVHTNLHTRFSVDTLKLAMIKTEWLAKKLFGGKLYDCVCIFEEGIKQRGRQQ